MSTHLKSGIPYASMLFTVFLSLSLSNAQTQTQI